MTEDQAVYLVADNGENCPKCQEAGAIITKGVISPCLKCLANTVMRSPSTIGTITIKHAKLKISEHLDSYHQEINDAYLACDNDLSINLKIKLQPHKLGGIDMSVGISFTESKINHTVKCRIDERQKKLFPEE